MNRILGAILIAISAASFGTLAIFGRYAYAAGLRLRDAPNTASNTLKNVFGSFNLSPPISLFTRQW